MRILIIVLALLLASCTVPAQETPPIPRLNVGQNTKTVSFGDRSARISTPAGFHHGTRWPVVFAFHGWGLNAESMEQTTELSAASAIVVYPDGVNRAWAPAPYASTSGEEDLGFVRTLLAYLDEEYPIDRDRVFATGFSNGGGFVAYLACQLPDTFQAVAPVSAAYYEDVHASCSRAPVARLDIHGTDDRTISYHGGTRHEKRYESVLDVLDRVAEDNGCEAPTFSRRSQDVVVMHWRGCTLPLMHVRVGGGAHEWPKVATSEIRTFFGV
ncbi:PHB depolymerase family esterase [Corynebacterium sp.]|uniref:alpha/beta hydrolase family esterase n=1 Tax=Corynebacterium sp. TaxID=1720 RepID=UPI0026DF0DBD|nr:alpha/beta hydrolase-fold protein [Corynebacterium sp.]MDO5511560.1 alpha/beta hydrolase-fold protein [Corynebacterium sp.]